MMNHEVSKFLLSTTKSLKEIVTITGNAFSLKNENIVSSEI